ncbi:DUF6364 family protein [Pedobacter segetis]|uniref:DUF6364 family protein n=1 Tax=Pedobacter segetis TaxID=2793069 RepID=UPI00293D3368|nr:DUF6364 family protein [Pedobacter segetis]
MTLKLKESASEKAKLYVKQKGISLSEIIENYVEEIIQNKVDGTISAKLNNLTGSIKLPADFDEKNEYVAILKKSIFNLLKYLINNPLSF